MADDYTFTVKLNAPSSVFKALLGSTEYAPLPDSFFDDPDSFGENPVGNGTYKFDSWDHNQSIKLSKNHDYKGQLPGQERRRLVHGLHRSAAGVRRCGGRQP